MISCVVVTLFRYLYQSYVYLTLPTYFLDTCGSIIEDLLLIQPGYFAIFFLEVSVSVQVFHLHKYL